MTWEPTKPGVFDLAPGDRVLVRGRSGVAVGPGTNGRWVFKMDTGVAFTEYPENVKAVAEPCECCGQKVGHHPRCDMTTKDGQ